MTKFGKQIVTAAAAACLTLGTSLMADPQTGTQGGQTTGAGQTTGTGQTGQNANMQGQNWQASRQELSKADSPDKLFLLHTAVDNRGEIQMAQLAQQKSQNQQVKQIAETMIRDHEKMAQDLQKVIDQQGLTTPQHQPALKEQELTVMQSLSGEDFDRCFISNLKAGHMAELSKFEDESRTAKDQSVKQFAAQYLPTLQHHAQMVQQAAVAVGLPSGTEAITAGSRIQGSSNTNTNSGGTGTSGSGTGSDTGRIPGGTNSGGSNPGGINQGGNTGTNSNGQPK